MQHTERGFTLVEVLVALVLASFLLAIVIDGAAGARARARYATEHEDAVRLGQSIITRATAGALAGENQGDEAGLKWAVGRTILMADPRGLYALFEIRVDISDKDGRHLENFTTRHLERLAAS